MTATRELPRVLAEAVRQRCDSKGTTCHYPACDPHCDKSFFARDIEIGWNAALRATTLQLEKFELEYLRQRDSIDRTNWKHSLWDGIATAYRAAAAHAESLIVGEGK